MVHSWNCHVKCRISFGHIIIGYFFQVSFLRFRQSRGYCRIASVDLFARMLPEALSRFEPNVEGWFPRSEGLDSFIIVRKTNSFLCFVLFSKENMFIHNKIHAQVIERLKVNKS